MNIGVLRNVLYNIVKVWKLCEVVTLKSVQKTLKYQLRKADLPKLTFNFSWAVITDR